MYRAFLKNMDSIRQFVRLFSTLHAVPVALRRTEQMCVVHLYLCFKLTLVFIILIIQTLITSLTGSSNPMLPSRIREGTEYNKCIFFFHLQVHISWYASHVFSCQYQCFTWGCAG